MGWITGVVFGVHRMERDVHACERLPVVQHLPGNLVGFELAVATPDKQGEGNERDDATSEPCVHDRDGRRGNWATGHRQLTFARGRVSARGRLSLNLRRTIMAAMRSHVRPGPYLPDFAALEPGEGLR